MSLISSPILADPPRRRAWIGASLLALLAIGVRVALLLVPGEQISPAWVLPEELHRGNIAHEVLAGPLLDLQDYHHAPNVGGSVVVGALAAPCMALLGDNLLAVRLPSVLLHGLGVALLFLLLARTAGRTAAWIGGLLYALGPPGYVLLSVTALGTHHENNTLVLLALLLFVVLQERLAAARGVSWIGFALGLTSGFACYFGYSFLAALALLVVLSFVHDRAFFRRRWFGFSALGFAIGFAPWLRYNLHNGFQGFTVYEMAPVALSDAGALATKLAWFVTSYLPDTVFLREFPLLDLSWTAVPTTVLLLLLGGFALVRARARLAAVLRRLVPLRAPAPPFALESAVLLYVPLFTLAMLLSPLVNTSVTTAIAHDGRYAAPLWPFACLALGLGVARLAELGRPGRLVTSAAGAFLLGTFVVGLVALCEPTNFPGSWRQRGTSDEELARFIAWKYKTDAPRMERLLARLEDRSEDVREGTLFVIGEALKYRIRRPLPGDQHKRPTQRALHFLHERVGERYACFFEDPWPGERFYTWLERDLFRRDRAAQRGLTDAAPR